MDSISKARDYVRENSNTIFSFVALIAFLVAGLYAYNYLRSASEHRAQKAYGQAMVALESGDEAAGVEAHTLVVDKHRNSIQAAYSAFTLAHLYLSKGDYDAAASWFEVAAENKRKSFVSAEALEGLALCAEARGDVDGAIQYLKDALEMKSGSYRYPAVRWKIALLSREAGKGDQARKMCKALLSDTLATEYKQKAENLLTELRFL